MTNKQKNFMSKASAKREHEAYRSLYIADSGRLYDGFFGKNGYNNIVIIGETEDGILELITDHSDHIGLADSFRGLNMDVSKDNGFIRVWLDSLLFVIPMMVTSSCLIYTKPRKGKA